MTVLRKPSAYDLQKSQMARYIAWLPENGYPTFKNYTELHHWSVTRIEDFWESIWKWSGIVASRPHEKILTARLMPGAGWFPGAKLNFAENLLQAVIRSPEKKIAITSVSENGTRVQLTCGELLRQVAAFAAFLRSEGVTAGDRVAGIVSNSPEPMVAMLAAASIGAVWSSCSPDFGIQGILDRFSQIEPKILISVETYPYNGKIFPVSERVAEIVKKIPSIRKVVWVERDWDAIVSKKTSGKLRFEQLPFDHPVYILYSSGTTGVPKCIVHGAGGVLLQHAKELRLHTDIGPEDKFFYFTTCGWMMWNWLVSGLMTGAELILYDGSPAYPDLGRLWDLAEKEKISVFGTSAKFLGACRNKGIFPRDDYNLEPLRTITSTGSPLLPEDFDWVYMNVKEDLLLSSISGGTDIVSCFVLGNPMLPVRRGEIQCKGLGMAVKAFSEEGREVVGEKGELVCTEPAPSMPVCFWNDPGGEKYRNAYFSRFPGTWWHGDYVMFNEHGGAVIYGRSDATLNPGGIRIGTAEIYRQVEAMEEIQDSLAVGQPWQGDERIVLFVVLNPGFKLDDALEEKIKERIRSGATSRHVPAKIAEVKEIPYTISGKKVEMAVAKILRGEKVDNRDALANPTSLDQFKVFAK